MRPHVFAGTLLTAVALLAMLPVTASAQQLKVGVEGGASQLKYDVPGIETDPLRATDFGLRAGWYDIPIAPLPFFKAGVELRLTHSRFALPGPYEFEIDGMVFPTPDRLGITSLRPGGRIGTNNPTLNIGLHSHLGYVHHRYRLTTGELSSTQNHATWDIGLYANWSPVTWFELGMHIETQRLFLGFDNPEQRPEYWHGLGIYILYGL